MSFAPERANHVLQWATVVTLVFFIAGCETTPRYELPDDVGGFASITVEGANKEWEWKQLIQRPKYFAIRSINRKRVGLGTKGPFIPYESITAEDSTYEILIPPGLHQIYVDACVARFKLLLNAGHYCAGVVLRLHAKSDTRYIVSGDINSKEDWAEFWIADISSGEKVTEPIRVNGFDEWK